MKVISTISFEKEVAEMLFFFKGKKSGIINQILKELLSDLSQDEIIKLARLDDAKLITEELFKRKFDKKEEIKASKPKPIEEKPEVKVIEQKREEKSTPVIDREKLKKAFW